MKRADYSVICILHKQSTEQSFKKMPGILHKWNLRAFRLICLYLWDCGVWSIEYPYF